MQLKYVNTVNFEYKNMLNRGNSGYNGHFTPDQTNFLMNENWLNKRRSGVGGHLLTKLSSLTRFYYTLFL